MAKTPKTLWGVLDATKTSMGSRMLKKWILEPLTELQDINARQQFTSFLSENREGREGLAEILSKIPDIERLLGRVVNLSAGPRDAAAVRKALGQMARLKLLLSSPRFFECVPELAGRMETVSLSPRRAARTAGPGRSRGPARKTFRRRGYQRELQPRAGRAARPAQEQP